MPIVYEISAKSGTYKDKQGNEKNSYTRCGVVMTTKNGGQMAKIEALPVHFDGWLYFNEPKQREEAQSAQTKRNLPADGFESDIPF